MYMSNSFQFYINSFETDGNDNLTGQFNFQGQHLSN